MKIVGAVVIIIASYIIGYLRRSNMLLGEKIISQLIHLIKEIKNSVEYGVGSLSEFFEKCAYRESYDKLTFINKACNSDEMNYSLSGALCAALNDWEHVSLITKDEMSVIRALFENIGKDLSGNEISKLDFAAERLKAALDARHELNSKRRGYYETIYVLAGIAVAILLI